MSSHAVYGLTLDLYPHQRLQDKDVLPLATVQLHQFPAAPCSDGAFKFASLEADVLSLIRDKVFIPGSMTRLALSNHFRDVGTSPHACEILSFHRQDPGHPSGLSSEPYSPEGRVPHAVLDHGRNFACVLSAQASKGMLLRRGGNAVAGTPFGVQSERRQRAETGPGAGAYRQDASAALGPCRVAQSVGSPGFDGREGRQDGNGGGLSDSAGVPPEAPTPFVGRCLSRRAPPASLPLSVLTEPYGEVRLEALSSTTVGEVLDRIQCSEGISPRDRQLFLYEVYGPRDLGFATALSDMASPMSYFASPDACTLPLTLRGEIVAVERFEKREWRRRGRAVIRDVREGLFETIGGRNEDEFYLFAERVLGDAADRSRALAGEDTMILQNLRPDSTVEALMAEVERKLGIPQKSQLLFHHGRILLTRMGDPSPVDPFYLLPDALETEEDRPAWAPSETTERKKPGAPLTLLDYRVDPDSTIQVRWDSAFHIWVKDGNGKKIPVVVRSFDRVQDLKAKIQDTEGIPVENQRLIFAGNLLEDDKLLSDSNVRKECTLILHIWGR